MCSELYLIQLYGMKQAKSCLNFLLVNDINTNVFYQKILNKTSGRTVCLSPARTQCYWHEFVKVQCDTSRKRPQETRTLTKLYKNRTVNFREDGHLRKSVDLMSVKTKIRRKLKASKVGTDVHGKRYCADNMAIDLQFTKGNRKPLTPLKEHLKSW